MVEPTDEPSQDELEQLFLENSAPAALPAARRDALRQKLLSRAAASAADIRKLRTIRARAGQWRPLRAGIQVKPLWEGPAGNSVLLSFQPGSSLPVHRHQWMEEGIVLSGGLQLGDLELGPGGYHCSPPGSRHGRIASRQGGLAYLRGTSLGQPLGILKELAGGLIPQREDRSITVHETAPDGWEIVAPGIQRKILSNDGRLSSYFCRVEAGTQLAGHSHALDEECMMISGEIFFGDLLLQAGDYQLAPAGSRHGTIASDTGALLFVRGPLA